MFTGIVQAVGRIESVRHHGRDLAVTIDTSALGSVSIGLGESISVSGVCLTAVECTRARVRVDVSAETLSRTLFGDLGAGARVNLEPALSAGDRLGGHLVSGHVDGVGELVGRDADGRSVRLSFSASAALARYVAEKGSICIDGVSLTVNDIADMPDGVRFEVNIVPHTLESTTFGEFTPGRRVHLEVDLVARYLERLITAPGDAQQESSALTRAFLARHGYEAGGA